MRLAPFCSLIGVLSIAGCDPDTTPIPAGDSDASADAAGGTGGTAGTGGSAGTGGTSGGAGEAGAAGAAGDGGEDAPDETGDAAGAGGSAGATGYSHTIVIDGTNDFDGAKEKFATSSTSPDLYQGYVAWDSTFLYVGMDGPAIANKSPNDWVVVYIGGTPGAQTGIGYGAQAAPGLPMPSAWHVRWKADGSFTDGQKWDTATTAWIPTGWTFSQASSGNFMEMSLPLLNIGLPSKLQLVVSMVREAAGNEWTWAGVPSTGLVDGKNKSYTKFFEFDFTAATAPNSYAPLP